MVYLSHLFIVSFATAQCQDVAQTGQLRVLTLNLLFSEFEQRDLRLQRVAAFIAQEDVHLILLQEVVGGLAADTQDSSQDLQALLTGQGLAFERQSSFETGVPGILEVKNAILSRCPILFSHSQTLSIVHEQTGGFGILVRREVSMVRI
jgi:maltose 6'-phosphate phosphatase